MAPAASECRSMGSGKDSVDVVFACMEAEESSALPRITTGRLDMWGRYMAGFVLVNIMPTNT